MIFDSHIHFGQFEDRYYTPPQILRILGCAGITHFAYSSTSAVVTDDPAFMFEERLAMQELSRGRAKPVLWVTHSMLEKSKDLSLYMDGTSCGFSKCKPVCGLKIHGVSESWDPCGRDLCRVFEIARERDIVVKFHTGERDQCYAGMYKHICQRFSDVRVILAHGRPLNQTMDVLRTCENVFVDTSFMPHEHLRTLLRAGFAERVLFGTDTPIPGRFLKSSLTRYLRGRISTSKKIACENWKKISWTNAQKLFQDVNRGCV